MASPKLSVPSSGLGGRGYRNPFTDEIVPGVTSVLGAIEKPGILNFHIENTVAYAATHIDDLLSRSEEQGMAFLRYYSRRLKQKDLDNREIDALNYTFGVLDDLAENGSFIHQYIEADLLDLFEPEPWRVDQEQMVAAYLAWKPLHSLIPVAVEQTFFGQGYGCTVDGVGVLDGVPTLWDNKSSRAIYDSHEAQIAAAGACHTWAREVAEGTEGAVHYKIVDSVAKEHGGQVDSWWVAEPVPGFSQYGVLQVRPDDYDSKGNFIPAFAEYHSVSQEKIESGFEMFLGALEVRKAQRKRRLIENKEKKGKGL